MNHDLLPHHRGLRREHRRRRVHPEPSDETTYQSEAELERELIRLLESQAYELNTLFVDKNLRNHGLIQAYSRTNRILNSVKTYGNIVAFRDLEEATFLGSSYDFVGLGSSKRTTDPQKLSETGSPVAGPGLGDQLLEDLPQGQVRRLQGQRHQ